MPSSERDAADVGAEFRVRGPNCRWICVARRDCCPSDRETYGAAKLMLPLDVEGLPRASSAVSLSLDRNRMRCRGSHGSGLGNDVDEPAGGAAEFGAKPLVTTWNSWTASMEW